MFRAFPHPSSGGQWLQWQPLVLPSYRGDSRAVLVVGPAGPTTNTEAATALIELLMMVGKTTETCWAVKKRQDNELLHQIGDLYELSVKLRCQKVKEISEQIKH